jgi:hypothetical protein
LQVPVRREIAWCTCFPTWISKEKNRIAPDATAEIKDAKPQRNEREKNADATWSRRLHEEDCEVSVMTSQPPKSLPDAAPHVYATRKIRLWETFGDAHDFAGAATAKRQPVAHGSNPTAPFSTK